MSEKQVQVPFNELLAYPLIYRPDVLVTDEGESLISATEKNPIVGYTGNRRRLTIHPEDSGYKISDSLHFGDVQVSITCVGGEGIALVQEFAKDKNGQPIPNNLDDFQSIPIGIGTIIDLPENCFIAFINTGKDRLVVQDNSPEKFRDLPPHQFPNLASLNLIKEKGFLFNVSMQNGEPWLSRSINFESVKRVRTNGIKIMEMH